MSEQWSCDIADGQVRLSPGGLAYQHYVHTQFGSGEPYGCEWMGAADCLEGKAS